MDFKNVDWLTIGPDMFIKIQDELGKELTNYCITLFGRDISNEEIADMIEKIKSDKDENQA